MSKPAFLEGWTVGSRLIDRKAFDEAVGTPVWADGTGLSIGTSADRNHSVHTLRFADRLVARVGVEQRQIELCILSPDIPQETLDHFLFDQILPRIVAHAGQMVLHAGAVAIEDEAVVFLGPTGHGKSTLVASFHEAGATLLGDDAQVVSKFEERFCCKPLDSGLRLYPDSIANIFRVKPDLTAFAHYSSKQRIALPPSAAGGEPDLPLAAMFFLGPEPPNPEISLRAMTVQETCMGIIANSFSLDPTDTAHLRGKLEQASAMAARTAAFELSYPRDYARLPEVRSIICDRLRSHAGVTSCRTGV